jgi:threonine dehydrogenase-like Zn-dependent dehydrogenase
MENSGTYKALVLNSTREPLKLTTKPIPPTEPGAVTVKVLASYILPYLKSVFDGTIPYTLALPLVPSSGCIARVHAAGEDATVVAKGQLVLCDFTIRARDDPANTVLLGLHGGAAPKLMAHWASGSFAEYAVFPLENVFPLDEGRLLGDLGYSVEDLCLIPVLNVPFGGLAAIDVKQGETVIVAPATGKFGGAAALAALSFGARVVAAGRNLEALESFAEPFKATGRIKCVQLSGDAEADTKSLVAAAGGTGADCYIDFSTCSSYTCNI